MKTKLLTILITVASLTTFGQIELLLNTDTNEDRRTITIQTHLGNKLLFSVMNNSFQTHLYEYDSGTVNEIIDNGNSIVSPIGNLKKDGKVFFSARVNNLLGGYSYNGSSLENIIENYFYNPVAYKNKIYFDSGFREGFVNKFYLFSSDGTKENTNLFKKIETFAFSGTHRYRKIVAGDFLFFTAKTDELGVELYRTDGTDAGTILLKDINPNSANSEVTNFFAASNGLLYFQAKNGTSGEELWVTNGTPESTVMLKDFYDGTTGGDFYLEELNGKIYIALEDKTDKLYETDGTPANTKPVSDAIFANRFIANFNNKIYFNGSVNGTSGIVVTDGTEAGTILLKELSIPVVKNSFAVYKNELYFNGRVSRGEGEHLWKTDGTVAGTILFKNTATGSIEDSFPQNLFVVGDELYFQSYQHNVTGREWWKTDGTEAGTVLVADTNSGRNDFTATGFYQFNNQLFFIGGTGDQTTSGLYKIGNNATASLNNNNLKSVNIFYNRKNIHIRGLEAKKGTLKIYNILGKVVKEVQFQQNTKQVNIPLDIKAGLYLIALKTDTNAIISKKIMID
ncbi:MAG: T9SS type A sorting domain-containing protein [Polaribacter sp.]